MKRSPVPTSYLLLRTRLEYTGKLIAAIVARLLARVPRFCCAAWYSHSRINDKIIAIHPGAIPCISERVILACSCFALKCAQISSVSCFRPSFIISITFAIFHSNSFPEIFLARNCIIYFLVTIHHKSQYCFNVKHTFLLSNDDAISTSKVWGLCLQVHDEQA